MPLDHAAIIDDARDGPTHEFRQKHDVTSRSGRAGGKRLHTKLEQLLDQKFLEPQESEAGRRFERDHALGYRGGRSCLSLSIGGPSDSYSDSVHQAIKRYREACEALNREGEPCSPFMDPAQVVEMLCVQDASWAAIGRMTGRAVPTVMKRVKSYMQILAAHYDHVDKLNGRSTTARTHALAMQRFDPDREEEARNKLAQRSRSS